tara:strand:- start:704 stop:1081 length:378 start_codon:yes stop_codon:yes gene_type:complete
MSAEWNTTLSRMQKPELLELAKKYNRSFDKIENINKLKKSELKVELLMREKKAKKIWSGEKKVKEAKPRKGYTKTKVLTNEEQNDLIKENMKLSKQATETKDIGEKLQLMKQIQKINNKLKRFMP